MRLTLLFEALLITFGAVKVPKVVQMVEEHATRIWRVIESHVARDRARLDFRVVRQVAMGEASAAKGHGYVSVLMDMDSRGVLFASEGKDAVTVEALAGDVVAHGGDPQKIARTSSGMSAAFMAEAAATCRTRR